MTDIDFCKNRSEWILETGQSLAPLINQLHSLSFSECFWTRLLTPYLWTVYNQKQHFESEDFQWPIAFQPINGWSPPDSKQVRKDFILAVARSLKAATPLPVLPLLLKDGGDLVFGARADIIANEFNAQSFRVNWIPFLGWPDKQARRRLLEFSLQETDFLRRNLLRNTPRLYVEYLPNLLRKIRTLSTRHIGNIYFEHFSSFIERLIAIYLSENGTTLHQLQLGAYIGETRKSILPLTRHQYDFHLTYGWKQHEKDVPFYAVRLEEFASRFRKHSSAEKDIDLLVVYNQVNSEETRRHYETCTHTLAQHLDRVKYPNVTLRPRGTTRWLSSRKVLEFLSPYFSSIDKGKASMASLAARARIIVHWNYPATNFLECLFVDHPVMCLISNESELTPLASEFVPHLVRLGLLHRTPIDLVSHLNAIDADDWWQTVKLNSWYHKFKETFARSKASHLSKEGRFVL